MRITIKAKPKSKQNKIEKIDSQNIPLPIFHNNKNPGENNFLVATKEPAVNNRANEAIIKIVADYFNVAPSQVKIISGHKSKNKILEIL